MSVQDDVQAVRTAILQVERSVGALRAHCGETLGIRRLCSDVRRLQDDLAEIGPLSPMALPRSPVAASPASADDGGGTDYSFVPGSMTSLEDEGLGGLR